MKLKFAGIKRQVEFSPNHVENDTLIFMKTSESLIEMGAEINIYNEEDVRSRRISENIIFSMAQGREANDLLLDKTYSDALIINKPQGVINCHRVNMVNMLPQNGIPFPKGISGDVESLALIDFSSFDCRKIWVKRGDVHAVHREDVTLVYSEQEKKITLKEFARRGIENAVLQKHLDGDVIKFYSIKGTDIFHWYYLNGINHTKFDDVHLKQLAEQSADILELDIYGGDAVISADGQISIIDINDWPSFAPIRNLASENIAKLILKRAKNYVNS